MEPGQEAAGSWQIALRWEPTVWPSLAPSLIHFTFLGLGFLIYKMRVVTGPTSEGKCKRDKLACAGPDTRQGLGALAWPSPWTLLPLQLGWEICGELQRDPGEMDADGLSNG